MGIDRLNTFTFDDAISRGAFIEYNKQNQQIICSSLHNALIDMSDQIRTLKRYASEITREEIRELWRVLDSSYNGTKIDTIIIAKFNSVYECYANIFSLSVYIIIYLNINSKELPYPEIIHGVVPDTTPTESEILNDMLKTVTGK